jgi:hypothetical protein
MAALLGIALVATRSPDDAWREVGKWLLQLSLVFVGTGVVSVVIRQFEVARAQREAWEEMLHQLVAAHDEAQMAARLLSAHATAKTYAEQVKVLTTARVTLRRLASTPEVRKDEPLHASLVTMRKYLKNVIKEYQASYLPVARQQRLDEEVLSYRLKKLAESDGKFPELPIELGKPLPAGLTLEDPDCFPVLNEFRTAFKTSTFRRAYESAKPVMQVRGGRVPTDAHGLAHPPAQTVPNSGEGSSARS